MDHFSYHKKESAPFQRHSPVLKTTTTSLILVKPVSLFQDIKFPDKRLTINFD